MKRLSELVRGVPCEILGNSQIEIKGIAYHSASVQPGFLFVAIEGFRSSGRDYIGEAINRGAVAVATTDPRLVTKNWVVVVQTQYPRRFLAQIANRFYDFPARKVNLIGVTGTNGKTTTTFMIRSIVRQMGVEPGFVGTVEYWDGAERQKAGQTTPESLELVQLLSRVAEKKIPWCIAEVSSHALELDRVFDLDFKAAVFTNLSQDHLDFHKTMEAYREAKLKLFTSLAPTAIAVVNYDDRVGQDIPNWTRARVVSYGTRPDMEPCPDFWGEVTGSRPDGLDCVVHGKDRAWPVRLKLVGRHNLLNLLAAFATGVELGCAPEAVVAGLEALEVVPGRLEPIPNTRGFRVFVDYAHTPEALRRLLATVREWTTGRLIVVFGCGGDRDRTKRPLMGQVVAEHADLAVVTSDNPRSEEPGVIIAEIVKGMTTGERLIEPDRRAAIRLALKRAQSGDTVVVAGKGHEESQTVGSEQRPFDDRRVCQEVLAELA
ncbi:MAG: UDP-N-acetylmuramoyl-L-alanyl-D-glutamate--2,6-diaminopimelate ligase [candidate division WOR-3 bacterium]